MIRSILKYMNVLNWLWGEAVRYITYLINRIVIRLFDKKILYGVLRNKKSNIEYFRVFGCVCYVKTNVVGRKKFDDYLRVLVYFGIEFGLKAYKFLESIIKKNIVNRNVVFDEIRSWN